MITPSLKLLRESDPVRVLSSLRAEGITQVLFFKNFYKSSVEKSVLLHAENRGLDLHWDWERLAGPYLAQIYEDKDVILYQVRGDNS
jgi:hypothetical protein